MASNFKWLGLSALLLGLLGCESVVELDMPAQAPVVVLNSVLNPDSTIKVALGRSQSALSNDTFPRINNAVVRLYENGRYCCNLQPVGAGLYRAPEAPQAGATYQLEASAPGLPSVTATTVVPGAPHLLQVRTQPGAPAPGGTLPTTSLFFSLADSVGSPDFYYVQAYALEYVAGRRYRTPVAFSFQHGLIPEFSLGIRYFFSDQLFSDQAVPLEFSLEIAPGQLARFDVVRVSQEYFEYCRQLERQQRNDNLFAAPVSVPGNVAGGLGILGGAATTTLQVR
ncbi:DUF4249 domain-containing protein [Hymenobacter lutimineralis]|uniref:DUF4249 domain-containing protein n=1 Tax=Hymenobacter lutimineralis TaxID=2606448 RepID=A0A5D6US12_9BACT|nr:DUF4249 domain-containing protein [Hymenobacter lutimineralis]TYZ06253.1 DUF4249 domain-containing protein [Hymenobacter lutimineralis]